MHIGESPETQQGIIVFLVQLELLSQFNLVL